MKQSAFFIGVVLLTASLGYAASPERTAQFVSEPVTPLESVRLDSLPATPAPVLKAGAVPRTVPRRDTWFRNQQRARTRPDGAAQPQPQRASQSTASSIVMLTNVAGIGDTGVMPPDTIGDVGPNHYVQMVNSAIGSQYLVLNKQGAVLAGPTEFSTLWPSGSPGRDYGYGDPIVLYDALSNRWFLSQFGDDNDGTYYLFIAVSKTADPLGAYHLYTFTLTDYFPDYPKYGVWPDGYYMASNEADFTGPWVGIWAFDRMNMLAGTAATYQKFQVQRNFMIPCDYDGPTPPPAGAPNYFYTMMDDTYWPSQGFPGVDRLEIWEYHVDWATPANSTFTHTRDVTNIAFIYDVGGDSWDVIPQKGTSQKVDAIGEWPMYRLQYRNFGGHETLVGNFTVDAGGTHAGVLWFELRKTSPSPWDMQQYGIYAPDANHRWMGSAAMNGYGDIALGYSVSSSTLYPAIRCAARIASDAPGTLGGESIITNGAYSQTSGNRWGDYSTMSVDPSNDATFWYTQEYIGSGNNWRTRIGVFNVVPEPQWRMLALVLAPLVRRRTSPA